MDIAFVGKKDKFVLIHLDYITIFSNSVEEHLQHLQHTFEKCKKYYLSLNPKKSQLFLREEKLLGHIVSRGVKIDPKSVESISNVPLPRNKKEIQVFLGMINFMRTLTLNYAKIVKELTYMLKKDREVKWTAK